MLDLLVKGFQLWEPGNKSKDIWKKKLSRTPLRMVYVQVRTKRRMLRINSGNQTTKNPLSGMSLDLSGDLGVVINLGFMDSKLFKINKV